jgi:hypothetical protein
VHLPPALTLAAQALLGEMVGVLGLTFSTPLFVVAVSVTKTFRAEEEEEEAEEAERESRLDLRGFAGPAGPAAVALDAPRTGLAARCAAAMLSGLRNRGKSL